MVTLGEKVTWANFNWLTWESFNGLVFCCFLCLFISAFG